MAQCGSRVTWYHIDINSIPSLWLCIALYVTIMWHVLLLHWKIYCCYYRLCCMFINLLFPSISLCHAATPWPFQAERSRPRKRKPRRWQSKRCPLPFPRQEPRRGRQPKGKMDTSEFLQRKVKIHQNPWISTQSLMALLKWDLLLQTFQTNWGSTLHIEKRPDSC